MPSSRLFRILKQPTIRESATSTLSASAATPKLDSGFTFVDNSQGASAAIAELARSLDFVPDQIDLEQELDDQRRLQLERLTNKAAEYSNSRIRDDVGLPWNCSAREADLISAACACSIAVYDPKVCPDLPEITFRQLRYTSSSTFGTSKATGIWSVELGTNARLSEVLLVVAVRGTDSSVDHMVNLNGRLEDSSKDDFLNFAGGRLLRPVKLHAGFFNSAKALSCVVGNEMRKKLSDKRIKHVLFTGHSAGGSTASILYAHFLSKQLPEFSSLTFSLITFGAAPVADVDITQLLQQRSETSQNQGMMLALVNEYDLVPRIDGPYIRSLVDLYRDIYDLPPISDAPPANQEAPGRRSLDAAALHDIQQIGNVEKQVGTECREWKLPEQRHHLIGEIILLKMRLTLEDGAHSHDEVPIRPSLRATKITHADLQNLIFCNIEVHKRSCYQQRVEMMRKGAVTTTPDSVEQKQIGRTPNASTADSSVTAVATSCDGNDITDEWIKFVTNALG